MDNLTHSLAGALLGRAGLQRLTGRAMPALIISANLPDIDRWIAPLIGLDPIAFHRGFTHGIGGMVLVPLVTALMVLGWERLRPGTVAVRLWPLLVVSLSGWVSHVLLDLMSNYGVRLLEPFSHRRFHTDSLFIIDPWIGVTMIAALGLSWRTERLDRDWRKPALATCAVIIAYCTANIALSERAEALTRRSLESHHIEPQFVFADPAPVEFWRRRMLWRTADVHGDGSFDLLRGLALNLASAPNRLDDPRLARAMRRDGHVRAFLFRSRMPIVVERQGRAYLSDQSYPNVNHTTIFVLSLEG